MTNFYSEAISSRKIFPGLPKTTHSSHPPLAPPPVPVSDKVSLWSLFCIWDGIFVIYLLCYFFCLTHSSAYSEALAIHWRLVHPSFSFSQFSLCDYHHSSVISTLSPGHFQTSLLTQCSLFSSLSLFGSQPKISLRKISGIIGTFIFSNNYKIHCYHGHKWQHDVGVPSPVLTTAQLSVPLPIFQTASLHMALLRFRPGQLQADCTVAHLRRTHYQRERKL